MMFYVIKKNRIFIFIMIISVIFVSYATHNTTIETSRILRVKRVEELKYQINNLYQGKITSIGLSSGLSEASDDQIFNETTLNIILISIKNMLTLFFKLIIILSFYQFFLYIRRWIILVSHIKIKFFVMRYLQLKDGKKNALAFQYSV